jgi:hypothetical protein
MNTNETIEIVDLEPKGEVKGGGDVNGDGRLDVIVGSTINGHIKASSTIKDGALLASFYAFQ